MLGYLNFVLIPKALVAARPVSCLSNRKEIALLVKDYSREMPHLNDLMNPKKVTAYGMNHSRNVQIFNCPDGGAYTIWRSGNQVTVRCSTEEHEAFRAGTATAVIGDYADAAGL